MDSKENDKNSLKHSKLCMSIQPFSVNSDKYEMRQQSRDAKDLKEYAHGGSREKFKRGISRVKNSHNASHKYLFTSSGSDFHKNTAISNHNNQTTVRLNPHMNHLENHAIKEERRSQVDERFNFILEPHEGNSKRIYEEYGRMVKQYEQLEAEQVVLDQENIELGKELNEWKQQYSKVFGEFKKGQQNISVLQQEIVFKNKCLQDKEEQIAYKVSEMEKLRVEIAQTQNKREEEQWKKVRQQNIEEKQKNRQFLIKYKVLQGQKIKYQQSYHYLQSQNEKLSQKIFQLQKQLKQFGTYKQEADTIPQYLQEIQKLKSYYYENQQLKIIIKEQEKKIKDNQTRRVYQIQCHQEEIKRIQQKQSHKCEGQEIIAKQEVAQLRELLAHKELQYQQVIQSMDKQFQNLLYEMKNKLVKSENQAYEQRQYYQQTLKNKQQEFIYLQREKNSLEKQKCELIEKLNSLECQNLTNNYSGSKELIRSRHSQQVNQKTSLQQQCQDKTRLQTIELQKCKDKIEGYQRKTKHLSEEIKHYEVDKNKWIAEKITMTEEITNLHRSFQKQQETHSKNLKESSQKNQTLTNILKETQIKNQMLGQKIDLLNQQIEIKSTMLKSVEKKIAEKEQQQKQSSLKRQQSERKKQYLQSLQLQLKQQIQLKEQFKKKQKKSEDQNKKLKEYVEILKSEIQICKQKNKVILLAQKEDDEVSLRISLIGKIYEIFGHVCEDTSEIERLRKLIPLSFGRMEELSEAKRSLDGKVKQKGELGGNQETLKTLIRKYQDKCSEYEKLMVGMEEAHMQKIQLVKQDYDIVYSKYMKYRNMVIAKRAH